MVSGLREAIVDHPEQPFVMVLFDAASPRTPSKWAEGNALARMLGQRGRAWDAAAALPVVVAGDLNGGPASLRSAMLAEGLGVTRSKPLVHFGGTFPAWAPWPLGLAVDDVWTGRGAVVSSWRTIALPGSDHLAVIVDVVLDPAATSGIGR